MPHFTIFILNFTRQVIFYQTHSQTRCL